MVVFVDLVDACSVFNCFSVCFAVDLLGFVVVCFCCLLWFPCLACSSLLWFSVLPVGLSFYCGFASFGVVYLCSAWWLFAACVLFLGFNCV